VLPAPVVLSGSFAGCDLCYHHSANTAEVSVTRRLSAFLI